MSDQPERMTREEIKEYIFDDLVEFLEETGTANAITPEEIAELLEEEPSRVKGCMMELQRDGVLESFKDDGNLYFQFAEDTLEDIVEEMQEDGWVPPVAGDDD